MRSILIGLDGSDYCASAVQMGIAWAQRFDCLLVALGIIDEPHIRAPEAVPAGAQYYKQMADERQVHDARVTVEQLLESFSIKCAEAQVASKVLEDFGDPCQRLALQAQRFDVVLIGQKTFFEFETSRAPDDNLKEIMRVTPRPVITAPEKLHEGSTLMVAYDGSVPAARALCAFAGTGLLEQYPVHVVCVEDDAIDAAKCTERAIEFLDFHGVKAERHTVPEKGKLSHQICQQAAELDAAAIVMGCYGQSTFKEFFLGSSTRAVIREATVPLYLYH